ncbi:putative protease HtpX [Natrarchaeobaculum sulfurireducens]|uniref:Putative protease HtpX n=2 Tax=Natrarchaeobaculum sulfurireducens TaxID=2044521 RepID=A0A346PKL6_9EURY|nr:M48 family metalloprotease [Natrarchaeobaculum sulfurireducens]AXR80061.1 putative protease HtpX [Natrarchaeobaculum sulfurireducens]
MSVGPTSLQVRMLAALVGLTLVTAGFLVGVWVIFYVTLLIVGLEFPTLFASIATAGTVLVIGYLEYHQPETVERLADAYPVDEETAPELYELTTRVAAQLGVPAPTIAVSDRDAPEALVVGFRPKRIHLVLSLGTIDALSQAELEAVIAHELAHVANRDAMVMTVVSLPVVIAEGIRSRIMKIENPGWTAVVIVPLGLVSTVAWTTGQAITARLSRTRERAADRAAAAAIGSPATLASALERLDHEIAATPNRDLREVSGVSSLSILPLKPRELEKVMLGPDGDREPDHWWLQTRLHRLERWLFDTHPPTDERVQELAALERET